VSLLDYERRFSELRVNTARGNRSPHKVVLMLAVMDLIESGEVKDNRFYFDEKLKRRFTEHFNILALPSDRDNPHLPFFHLRSEGFWHHKIRPGHLAAYQLLTTATSPSVLDAHIAYAYLDDELFELLGNQIARELLKTALQRNLDRAAIQEMVRPIGGSWDWLECEYLVQDYMSMLEEQLAGVPYNKAEHRRALRSRLNNRSNGSVEYKHQNVSAILLELGLPYIPGYKPAFNYQQMLRKVVLSYLAGHQYLLDDIGEIADSDQSEQPPSIMRWDDVIDPRPPEMLPSVAESRPSYIAKRIDFGERERRNRQLGERAEAFVVELEKQRLISEGRADLAAEVEWSSKEKGDGLGFDIRSFDARCDEERFLEVKATTSGKYFPFYISENERAFSNDQADAFRLYRLYEFNVAPRLFVLEGAIEAHVHLIPRNYLARF